MDRFWDIASYWSKVVNCDLPHICLAPPFGVIPLEFRRNFFRYCLRDHRFNHFHRTPTWDRQRDRQTDGQTDEHTTTAYTALTWRRAVIKARKVPISNAITIFTICSQWLTRARKNTIFIKFRKSAVTRTDSYQRKNGAPFLHVSYGDVNLLVIASADPFALGLMSFPWPPFPTAATAPVSWFSRPWHDSISVCHLKRLYLYTGELVGRYGRKNIYRSKTFRYLYMEYIVYVVEPANLA